MPFTKVPDMRKHYSRCADMNFIKIYVNNASPERLNTNSGEAFYFLMIMSSWVSQTAAPLGSLSAIILSAVRTPTERSIHKKQNSGQTCPSIFPG